MAAIYWPDFPTFTYPSPIWRHQRRGSPRAIGFIFRTEKLEWLGYNLVKVAWWSTQSFEHNTSTWQTHRQPRRYSKCRADALSCSQGHLLEQMLMEIWREIDLKPICFITFIHHSKMIIKAEKCSARHMWLWKCLNLRIKQIKNRRNRLAEGGKEGNGGGRKG